MVLGINGVNTFSPIYPNRKVSKKSASDKVDSKKEDMGIAYSILLNKAYSKGVVDYAHTLYSTIVDLKDSSKELGYFVDEYKTVEDKIETLNDEKKEQVNDMFDERVKEFVYNFGVAFEFANKQKHSQSLLDFSSDLSNITYEYEEILDTLGISESDTGELITSFDLNNDAEKENINIKLESIKSFADEVYNSTKDILSKPMSEHMDFRELKYYYNYKLDDYKANTFILIESGMIVDISL